MLNFNLQNKTYLITGATRGIGKEIAIHLAKQGANIIFNYRNKKQEAEVFSFAKSLEIKENKAYPLYFDLNDENTFQESLTNFFKENSALELNGLINNAGISKDHLALRAKSSDIDLVLNTNLNSTIKLTNFSLKFLLKATDPSVVNISSVVGLMGNLAQSTYAASKAGIIGYTKSMAKEYAGKKLRFNAICPGFIQTDMTQSLSDVKKEEYLKNIPLKEFGSCEDVSNLVLFLLSSGSKYITGEIIKVDGGLYI